MQRAHRRVERVQALRRTARSVRQPGAANAAPIAAAGLLRAQRVLPPVRVVALDPGRGARVDDVLLVHPGASSAPSSHSSTSPPERSTTSALASALTSSRAHLVLVRVGVGRQQRGDVRAGRDVAGHVGELGRRGDDPSARPSRRRRRCRSRGDERQQREENEGGRGASRAILLKLIPIFIRAAGSRSRPRHAPIAAMLCSQPLMDGPHRLTRRQALRLGAGAAALGALRVPSPAFGASRRRCSSSPLADARAHAAGAALAHDRVLRGPAPLRPRRPALGARHARCRPRSARAPRGGRWTRWTPLPRHARRRRAPAPTPSFTGAADELQLRLRGSARGLQAALRARPPPRARARAPAPRRPAGAPPISPRAALGRRAGPAAHPARATAPCRPRSSTTRSPRSTTRRRNRPGSCSASRATTATPTAGTTSVTTSSSTATA